MASKKPIAKKRTEKRATLIDILPYIFIIAVVPLIVHLYLDKLTPIEASNWTSGNEYADLLSFWKSRWFIIASALGLFIFIIRNIQGRVPIRINPPLHIPTAIYILFIIISTVASEYVSVALSGFAARYEGMFILLFYILNMLIIFSLISEEGHFRIIFGALLVSASIICILGITQLAGRDFFNSNFGKSFILPAKFAGSELAFRFGKMVYGTLPNPNYMGSYVDLVFPIVIAVIFLAKKKSIKIAAAVLSVLLLINLIGSRSDAGLVGLGAGLLLAVIYFRKKIFRNKVITVISLVIVLAAAGFAAVRFIPSYIDSNRQSYYVEDIVFEGSTAKIVSSTETLVIRYEDPNLTFHDADNKQLEIDISAKEQSTTVKFKDPAYKKYTATVSGGVLEIQNDGVKILFLIRDNSLALMGNAGNEIDNISKPDAIDVRGYEKIGSARIYIWSRAIPLLKNSILTGYGPDTFAIEFPQYDYIGKINAYGTPNM
ncbi:MAG: hypothetical protein GX027_08125, partial [Clostridiaceae bacterium]|nr:hypothetical protein [Clostridiaceae bacterium]